METISSPHNPKIKNLLELQSKSRERLHQGLFALEGRRETEHCISAGYAVRSLYICPEIFDGPSREKNYGFPGVPVFEVSAAVYDKIAYRSGTEGIVAEIQSRQTRLTDLRLGKSPLVVVLESVEKPGNIGAVLRSADAAGADAVIVCDPLTDLYNPNLLRASTGAAFTVPTVACTSEEAITFLKGKGFSILSAQLQDSSLYYDTDMTGPTAIVLGTESTGLTPLWREAASSHIRIPMLGRLDSLNVSVSAAILLFEAVRQRQFKTSKRK